MHEQVIISTKWSPTGLFGGDIQKQGGDLDKGGD